MNGFFCFPASHRKIKKEFAPPLLLFLCGLPIVVIALLAVTAGTLYQRVFCPRVDLRASAMVQFVATGRLIARFGTGPAAAFGTVSGMAPRARIAVNAAWPGVSRKVIMPRGVCTW